MHCMRSSFRGGEVLNGRYRTVNPLNKGSFGMVFQALDLVTGQDVAIKIVPKYEAEDDPNKLQISDDKTMERRLHALLGPHENIVNLIDYFETAAHSYMVLELCSRGDLYEAIRQGFGPRETEHVRRISLELVSAVEYAHSRGVYHRDIKPENIFLTQDGSIKLGDFGLATTDTWTMEPAVGSDRYMSPEQWDSDGSGYNPAQADIWAVGIVILNMLFERNPFNVPSEEDRIFLDYTRDKQSLFDVFPTMSQDTFEVLDHCLNLNPQKRSLAQAREALVRLVSFTTEEEDMDDFENAERRGLPDSNREPLRTPSIQSPQPEQGAFPWSKILEATAPKRQLSVIPDAEETYSESLFTKSEDQNADWASGALGITPSAASLTNAPFSVTSAAMSDAMRRRAEVYEGKKPAVAGANIVAGSLPIAMSTTRKPAMSLVFGASHQEVSKSWSDMWDEDMEEEAQLARDLETRAALNARTYSHESIIEEDETIHASPAAAVSEPTLATEASATSKGKEKETVPVSQEREVIIANDNDLFDEGLFFGAHDEDEDQHHDVVAGSSKSANVVELEPLPWRKGGGPKQVSLNHRSPKKQPSLDHAKKSPSMDKWAQLGERRRRHAGTSSDGERSPDLDAPAFRTPRRQAPARSQGGWSTTPATTTATAATTAASVPQNNPTGGGFFSSFARWGGFRAGNKTVAGNTPAGGRNTHLNWREHRGPASSVQGRGGADAEWVGGSNHDESQA